MNRAEKLEELLSSKTFDELTLSEKELVLNELGSEEQYEAMRKIGVTLVKRTAGLSPDPKILKSLQHYMHGQQNGFTLAGAFTFRMPVYASVLLIILFSIAAGVISRKTMPVPNSPVTVVKTDTVYLTTKADTIFQERVIYRYAKLKKSFPQQLNQTVQAEPLQQQTQITGVNMKESEALEKLLVSGSR